MNKIPIFSLTLLFALILPLFANAQVTVKGIVTDESGVPLVGVSVRYKEVPQVGVTTDIDGKFSIKEVNEGKTLVFSYIGMKNAERLLKGTTSFIKIQMEAETSELDQVVITGYTQTTFKKMTGSVGIITADQLKDQAQPTVDALMQGKIAGVAVSAVTGQPGSTQKIRIRGTNTITGDGQPLWVIDGVPVQESIADMPSSSEIKSGQFDDMFMNGIAGINPSDIESITILKDASATAIYGSRAAGGVIVVTTKKGKQGKTRINYSGNVSVTLSPQRDYSLMNSQEKIAFEQGLWDEFSAPYFGEGKTDYPVVGIVGIVRSGKGRFSGWNKEQQDAYLNELSQNNTNWYDELFRNGVSTTHNLSISGGGEKYTYYTSLAYTRNAGLLKNNNYDRYNITANLTMTPNQKVRLDFGASMSYQDSKSPALSTFDPFQYAYFANPYENPYNTDGSYCTDETYYTLGKYNYETTSRKKVPDSGFNIMREMNETSSRTKNINTTVRAGIDYSIISKLRFVGLASYTYSTNRLKEIYGDGTKAALDNRMSVDYLSQKEYASVLQRNIDNDSYMIRGHFAYDDQFGSDHAISLIAGAELRGNKSNGLFSKRYGYDSLTGNTITPLPSTPEGVNYDKLKEYLTALDASSGETWNEQKFASFYASADYYYKTKYILNASFRTDGSSNFGSDQQFNPNWAAGAAWNISEENFMQSIKPVLNRLTLRLATGFTGNISRAVSPQLIINLLDDYRNVANNVYHIGSISSPPNPNLRWEKTKDMKVALDFGLFNDRLTGIIEGYYRKTTDMVTSVRVLTTTGYSKQQYNTANVENKGIEATLNGTPVKTKDFTLSLSGNIAYNMNRITRYKDPLNKLSYAGYWEGYPMEAIYSGRLTGIDPDTGLYSFQLRPDAEINTATDLNKFDNYQFYLGTGEAPITGGFNITAEYKGVRLSVNGTYATGSKVLEYIKPPVSYQNTGYGTQSESTQVFENDLFTKQLNVPKIAGDRWTPNNTDGTYPRVWNVFKDSYNFGYYNPMDPNITRGAYLTNLSYVRIKSIIVGYSLPKKLLNQTALSNVDFSMALNNFFTFTSYKGMDPETPGATYPVSRSVMFSVNVGF